jgi:hypothetical protein
MASVAAAGASAERGAERQPTYASLAGPSVARAGSLVTLRGSIGIRGSNRHASSGHVVIQSRPAGTANWRTLARLALTSDGAFVFKTRVRATRTQGARNVFFRVVFAGDATHRPSTSKARKTDVVTPSTQPPSAAPPTATVPPSVPVSIPPAAGLSTDWPVTALAADGGRVAYATCAGVFAWDTTTPQATEVATARLANNCIEPSHWGVSSVALAGDRLAYVDAQGGNTSFWSVVDVSLATTPQSVVLASGSNTVGPPLPRVAGSGELLAFASRDLNLALPYPPNLPWYIETIGRTGCPCQEILGFAQPGTDTDLYRHLDDVDNGRLVVSGAGLTRILDTDGKLLLTLSLDEPSYAQLSGDDLVVQLRNATWPWVFESEVRGYSAATATLLHTWPLTASTQQSHWPALQDVAHGLAAYTVDGKLHLLRLSDGSDTIIGPGDLARFADTGLVVATGPRIQLIPNGELPLH